MDFKLEFNMDNAAFTGYPEGEASRILKEIASRIRDGQTDDPVFDLNGNNIGEWEITID